MDSCNNYVQSTLLLQMLNVKLSDLPGETLSWDTLCWRAVYCLRIPASQMQTELLQVPWDEHIGWPGHRLLKRLVRIVVMFSDNIVTLRVKLKVWTALSMVTLSDCRILKRHESMKWSSRPKVAMSTLPVNYAQQQLQCQHLQSTTHIIAP